MGYVQMPGHRITHMTRDGDGRRLVTGAGTDVQLWRWESNNSEYTYSLTSSIIQTREFEEEWEAGGRLLSRANEQGGELEMVITGLHWVTGDTLVISYKKHGVQ